MLDMQKFKKFLVTAFDDHDKKLLKKLEKFNLDKLLQKRNPFYYAYKIIEPKDLVKQMFADYQTSSEETVFGKTLESVAIYILDILHKGKFLITKKGIDAEALINAIYYIFQLKSGPNWGNADQISKMISNLKLAKSRVKQTIDDEIKCVNGCFYGKDRKDGDNYTKICGQEFWELITGETEFYKKLILLIADISKSKDNSIFITAYNEVLDKFVSDFSTRFCKNDGTIDWEKLVEYNSGK